MTQSTEQYGTDHKEHGVKNAEVFVGGLPRTISEDKIREVFSSCGQILEIRLIKDPKGNLKGFGFVRFATKEAAACAVREKSGTVLDGKKIGVLPSTQQDTLYFGSLNKAWGADEFEHIVNQVFSDVVSVDLVMLKDVQPGQKHRNRGFAFVKFSSHAAASRAQRVGSQPDFRLGNLHPAIQWAEEEPKFDPNEIAEIKIAFVRSLPADADENFLRQLFEPFGKVEKVVVSNKGSSPVGFVHFTERSDLDRSVKELNEKTIRGPGGGSVHKIQVEVARPMDKKKKRARDDSESNPSVQGYSKSLKEEPSALPPNNRSSHFQRQELESIDAYEDAVLSLPIAVRERLLRILRLEIATRFDIDVKSLCSLKQLPESIAISVLDQFMLSGAASRDKGAYLDGLISRHLDKVGLSRSLINLSRVADTTAKESEPFSFSTRVSSHAHSAVARTDIYGHYLLPHSESPLSSRTLFNQVEDRGSDFLKSNRALSGGRTLTGRAEESSDFYIPSQVQAPSGLRTLISRMEDRSSDMLMPNQGQPQPRMLIDKVENGSEFLLPNQALSGHQSMQLPRLGRVEDRSVSPLEDSTRSLIGPGRIISQVDNRYISPVQAAPSPSTSYPGHGISLNSDSKAIPDRQGSRPQMRFDPFTGEPYKFDPFTGEPIRPESGTRQF